MSNNIQTMTPEDKAAYADALGCTVEELDAMASDGVLKKGTYRFKITAATVKTKSDKSGSMAGAKFLNLALKVVDDAGEIIGKYETVWKEIILPYAAGNYQPKPEARSYFMKDVEWLGKAANIAPVALVLALKGGEAPESLVDTVVIGDYSTAPRKDDPTKFNTKVYPSRSNAKVTSLGGSVTTTGGASSEVPF